MKYVYQGSAKRLQISGQTLLRGQPTELDGAAAEAAKGHPDIQAVGSKPARSRAPKADGTDGLAERRALVSRAKELGIPATGKSDALKAAIADAEAKAAAADTGS